MRIAVFGGSGVLGRLVVAQLIRERYNVTIFTRSLSKVHELSTAGAQVVSCDLFHPDASRRLTKQFKDIYAVINLVSPFPPTPDDPESWKPYGYLWRTAAQTLVETCLTTAVERYIQLSSILLYANGGEDWLDENTGVDIEAWRAPIWEPMQRTEYIIKLLSEKRLHWIILRAGMFVGPDTQQDLLIYRLTQKRQIVPGDGSFFISPVHVADMAAAVLVALRSKVSWETVNIVDDPIHWGEYVDRLAEIFHSPPPVRHPDEPMPPSLRCSNAKALMLGWKPEHSIWRGPFPFAPESTYLSNKECADPPPAQE